nr:hypothetical protein [Tanacetum cinerariifolium]
MTLTKVTEQMTQLTSMCEMACQFVQKNLEEKQLEEEQAAKAQSWKFPVCYDDDEEILGTSISTLFRLENLVSNPSESEGANGCDVPAGFTTFSNVLFDDDYDFDSSDDQSLSDEDIDSLFDEFAGELTLLKLIPSGIEETDCPPEKETHLTKRLFDPLMEEIDLYINPDDPISSSIEEDDDDSERDMPILEKLLDSYSLSLAANESYHFDIPSPYRPPAKPPDGNTGTLNIKMMDDVADQKVPIPGLTITRVLNQEKSPDLLSHLGFEAFQPSAECPLIINGKNIPLLDIDSPFQQTSSLKPYVPNVTLEKIIIDLEDEVVSLLKKEKANLETIESLKSKGFESSENYDKEENPKVIAPGMFKLNVSQCVSQISMSKSSYLDTFSSVRRPKHSSVVWKKKWSSNSSNVGKRKTRKGQNQVKTGQKREASPPLTQTRMANFVLGRVVIEVAKEKDVIALLKRIQKFSMTKASCCSHL